MNESDALLPPAPKTTMCSNCRKNTSVDLIYVCTSGHDICAFCNMRLKRCLLCMKQILDLPLYYCKYQKYGCGSKAIYDEIRFHETDCDYKELFCPFQNLGGRCNWYECEISLRQHLEDIHGREVIHGNYLEGDFPQSDKVWVFIAHEKVFKCYVWMYEFHVDWLIKYIGPQKYSTLYTYRLKLYRQENVNMNLNVMLYKNSSKSTGYNNMPLEECISIPVKDLKEYSTKGKILFKFKILKNKNNFMSSNFDDR